jgi:tRNA nucleotidyltransferase (CCA-adding enzyme)
LKTDFSQEKIKKLFEFPNNLEKVFLELKKNGFSPVVVGGFVRDRFLGNKNIKDIDVEVFHVPDFEKLTTVLKQFGTVNLVGKSFGVLKLTLNDVQCDFSLPRKENKIAQGHKGFTVTLDANLNFKEAAQRRDFTINAMGVDAIEKKLYDPYNGLKDLQNKLLRCVDEKSFVEDPLRVLRGVVFAARFSLHVEEKTKKLFCSMIAQNQLNELPKERVFEELKKLFFKAKKPSIGFRLLKEYGEKYFFSDLFELKKEHFNHTLEALDILAKNKEKDLTLFLAVLCLHVEEKTVFLAKFTNEKTLLKEVENIFYTYKEFLKLQKPLSDFELKLLATKINLKQFFTFLKAINHKNKNEFTLLEQRAKKLGVFTSALKPLITGKDLIQMGLNPSKEFKNILHSIYLDQLQGVEINKEYLEKKVKF